MKRSDVFRFKQFDVRHGDASHKVGTDAVLLGSWVNVPATGRVLDVGTGTGVIALMIAQRTNEEVIVDAVEVQAREAEIAAENFHASRWQHRLRAYATSLQDFKPNVKYELIVCNPPFFINSLSPPAASRDIARHSRQLSFEDLAGAATEFLSQHGVLAVVLPPTECDIFLKVVADAGFYLQRSLSVQSRENKPIERRLVEVSREKKEPSTGHLIIHGDGDAWSLEYVNLTQTFYIKL